MILAIPLRNDNYRDCTEYFKLDYERHISNHVEKEVFTVIGRLRLISLDIFKHIKDYIISKNIPLLIFSDIEMNEDIFRYYEFKNIKTEDFCITFMYWSKMSKT